MRKTDDAEAEALPTLVRSAGKDVDRLRKSLLLELSMRPMGDSPVATAQIIGLVRKYGAAILKLTSLEDQIEQDSSKPFDLVQGDSVDLENARREITDRIARFRERTGRE